MTHVSEIIDLFMTLNTDYRLLKIFEMDEDAFTNYVQAWLILSLALFNDYRSPSLSIDSTTNEFNEELSYKDKTILAQLMVRFWLEKEVNDILAMRNLIQDHDFKTHSAAANLDAKRNLLNQKIEETNKLLISYSYKEIDWDKWYASQLGW